jgi:two-component system, OmpR family, response regulator
VEDDEDSRIMIAEYLRFELMEVTSVATVAEAQDALSRMEFDALVCDLRLPDGDGYGLVAAIRSSKAKYNKMAAIGITAHTESEDRGRALSAGFDEYLAKTSTGSLARKLDELSRRPKPPKPPKAPKAPKTPKA